MQIRIVDEEGLGTALMMDGFSDSEVENARQAIRSQFRDAAQMLFRGILEKKMPDTMEVRMVQNTAAEREERESVRLASFDSARSRDGFLVFLIYEATVKHVLEEKDAGLLRTTVIHEMTHAADFSMIRQCRGFLGRLADKISKMYGNVFEQTGMNAYEALYDFLDMLRHYRNEGVALLGQCLLTRKKFPAYGKELDIFNRVFELSLMWAKTIANGEPVSESFRKQRYDLAYSTSPFIMLLVLDMRKSIGHSLVLRLQKGLRTGVYDLTDDEISEVLSQSMSLSLSTYIQGILEANRADCHVAPIVPFLELCALLQNDYDEDSIGIFSELMENPGLVSSSFVESIEGIMGSLFADRVLEERHRDFCQNPPDPRLYPRMLDKVGALHGVIRTDKDPDRRLVAQWALTYLYDDIDVIHDRMLVIGLMDDMMVLDCALEVLGLGCTF